MKNRGPRIEPRGTPHRITSDSDLWPLLLQTEISDKNSFWPNPTLGLGPHSVVYCHWRMLWFTVSNALDKSTNTPAANSLRSRAKEMMSYKLTRAREVEWFLLKPYWLSWLMVRLMMWVNGTAMQWIDCLMVKIGILPCPAALPDLNELAMLVLNSSFVAELKKMDWEKLDRR